LIAETCLSHDHDPQWLFPRVLFRGRQFHKLEGYHPFAALLQVLIASFTKILSAVSAQAESEQRGGMKHGYPVVAGMSPALLNCAADTAASTVISVLRLPRRRP
jgi:hypothetical protein